MSQTIRFCLALSYHKYIEVYRGNAEYVVARSFDGRTLRFPADILKPYLTREGIYGTFAITFDSHHKLQSLTKEVNESIS